MRFYIVDAFTKELMGGNTAGVVLVEEDSIDLNKELMKKTAEELKYNITVFVQRTKFGEFIFKFFSPVDELDLCGHATIAAFTALLEEGWIEDNHAYVYHTPVGALEAMLQNRFVMIEQGNGNIGKIINEKLEMERIYEILGVDYQEVYIDSPEQKKRVYPALVSTGIQDMLVPVKSKVELEKIDPDDHVLKKMSQDYGAASFHVFYVSEENEIVHCRNFAPLYGVREDIATGTSNASLLYYLHEMGILQNRGRFIQGEKMGRKSRIIGDIGKRESGELSIRVGGMGRILVKGEIYLSE